MNFLNERPLTSGLIIGVIIGLILGLLYAWGIAPVEWTDTNPSSLHENYKSDYVYMTAQMLVQTNDIERAKSRLTAWPDGGVQYVCQLYTQDPGDPEKQNLSALAQALQPGVNCAQQETAAPAEEQDSSLFDRFGLVCGLGLAVIVLVGAIFYFLVLRRGGTERAGTELPAGEPTASLAAGARTIPLAQFPTEFNIGHDTYDDSFSVETATGEFLGECGVGISESIGVGSPKKVTAFEVWLFDKNDIRTVTKVIMSEHAYYDEALRAKLAPKGEASLAKPGETVVLETAALIINARIVEMEYGTGELPPQSFFNRMVVELAAWAKETQDQAGDITEESATDDFTL